MTDSYHCIGDSLFIDDISLIKINGHAKTFPYQCLQYLNLNFSHELHFNLPQYLIPVNMKLWLLVLQDSQVSKQLYRITVSWQCQFIIQYRFQYRHIDLMLPADPLSGLRLCESGNRTDHTGLRFIDHLIFCSGIDADLIHLFLPAFPIRSSIQQIFYLEHAACHSKPCQTIALLIPAYFEYTRAKFMLRLLYISILFQTFQQFIHPVKLQCRSKITRKYMSVMNQLPYSLLRNSPMLKIVFQCLLLTDCYIFQKFP